jgi:hypothetical protein
MGDIRVAIAIKVKRCHIYKDIAHYFGTCIIFPELMPHMFHITRNIKFHNEGVGLVNNSRQIGGGITADIKRQSMHPWAKGAAVKTNLELVDLTKRCAGRGIYTQGWIV